MVKCVTIFICILEVNEWGYIFYYVVYIILFLFNSKSCPIKIIRIKHRLYTVCNTIDGMSVID